MTMQIRIENMDAARRAVMRITNWAAFGDRVQTTDQALPPGSSAIVYIHAACDVTVTEDPAAALAPSAAREERGT